MGASHSTELDLAMLSRSLIHTPVNQADRATWSKLWTLPQSIDECYDNFTLELVRNIREKRGQNFCSMMKLICLQINQIVTMSQQHQIIHQSSKQASKPSINQTISAEQVQILLNCIRILTRLISVVNENPQSALASDFMFGGPLPGMLEQHEAEIKQAIEQARARAAQEAARLIQQQLAEQAIAQANALKETERLEAQRKAAEVEAQQRKAAELEAQQNSAAEANAQLSDQSSSQTNDQSETDQSHSQSTSQSEEQTATQSTDSTTDKSTVQSSQSTEQPTDPPNEQSTEPVAHQPSEPQEPTNRSDQSVVQTTSQSSHNPSHDDQINNQSITRPAEESNTGVVASTSVVEPSAQPTDHTNTQSHDASINQSTNNSDNSSSHINKNTPEEFGSASSHINQPADESTASSSSQSANPSTVQTANTASNQPSIQPVPQSVDPPVGQPIKQPVSQSVEQPVEQSISYPPLDEWWYGSLLGQPLAHMIVRLLIDCCFLPGFTMPELTQSPSQTAPPNNQATNPSANPSPNQLPNQPLNPALWEVGFGFPPRVQADALQNAGTQASSHWQLDNRRTEVLRCLLVCFASNMFLPSLVDAEPDRWLDYFVSKVNNLAFSSNDQLAVQSNNQMIKQSVVQNSSFGLVLSMLNLLLSYRPDGALPYSAMVTTDYRQPVVELAAQILMIVLDFSSDNQFNNPMNNQADDSSSNRSGKTSKRSNKRSNKPSELSVSSSDDSDDQSINSPQSAQSSQPNSQPEQKPTNQSNQLPMTPEQRAENGEIDVAMLESATGETTVVADPNTKPSTQSVNQITPSPSSASPQQRRVVLNQPSARSPSSSTSSTRQISSQPDNVIYHQLFLRCSPSDLSYLYSCVCRLLHVDLVSRSTWMLGSAASITVAAELFVIVWKFLDESPLFLPHVIEHCDVIELVTPLLFYIYDARADPSKLGLMYTCVFILLKLSGEREFAVALNAKLPTTYASGASLATLLDLQEPDSTYADALIYVAHRFIVSSPAHLDASLYGALLKVLLTLLTNVSPYLTRLSASSSLRILSLVELFTKPEFLYSNPQNHQYTLLLLDFLNNAIQYQFAGSVHLILHIVKRARLFYSLRVFDAGSSDQGVMKGIGAKGHRIVIGRPLEMLKPTTPRPTTPATPVTRTLNAAANPSITQPTTTTTNTNPSPAAPANQSTAQPTSQPDYLPIQPEDLPDLSTYRSPSFVATHQWANGWKARLPLEAIYRLLDFMVPKVEWMALRTPQLSDTTILEYLSNTTLVGVLPVPHPIVVRRYIRNPFTNQWFRTYLLGLIFLRNQQPKLWEGRKIALFAVTTKQAQSRQQSQANSVQASRRTSLETNLPIGQSLHSVAAPAKQDMKGDGI